MPVNLIKPSTRLLELRQINAALEALAGGGSGGGLAGTATVTLTQAVLQHSQTVAAAGVTASKVVLVSLAPALDTDENDPELLDVVALRATPGTDAITFGLTFNVPTVGPIKLNWSAT